LHLGGTSFEFWSDFLSFFSFFTRTADSLYLEKGHHHLLEALLFVNTLSSH